MVCRTPCRTEMAGYPESDLCFSLRHIQPDGENGRLLCENEEYGNQSVNKNLDFTKAQHIMLSFGYKISDRMNLKIEPYVQFLHDVPVMADSSYSVLNRSDFYVEDALVNKGRGRNIGIDITLERFLEKGLYYMISGSLFDSVTVAETVYGTTRSSTATMSSTD